MPGNALFTRSNLYYNFYLYDGLTKISLKLCMMLYNTKSISKKACSTFTPMVIFKKVVIKLHFWRIFSNCQKVPA